MHNALTMDEEKAAVPLSPVTPTSPSSLSPIVSASDPLPPITYLPLTFATPLPAPHAPAPLAPPDGLAARYADPRTWSPARKAVVTAFACAVTCIAAYAVGAYSPAQAELTAEWGIGALTYQWGITALTTGFAMAPMVLAPVSEVWGRRWIVVGSGALVCLCQLGAGLTDSFTGMIFARFFMGVGGPTFSSIMGGVISDVYPSCSRNTPMALFSAAVFVGTGVGPLISSFIAQHTWARWIFFHQVIMAAVLVILLILFFKEPRASVLLVRKKNALNKWYEACEQKEKGWWGVMVLEENIGGAQSLVRRRVRWEVTEEKDRPTLTKMIGASIYRPFKLLFTEPVVFLFTMWISFAWAVLYIQFASIPYVFTYVYGFNLEESGAAFSAVIVGGILSAVIGPLQEKLPRHHSKSSEFTPEERLYFSGVLSVLLPIGLFWFGWTANASIHWIVPSLALVATTIGICSVYLAVFNYLADTYHRYTSSALAAQSFTRNIIAGFFPIVVRLMFERMGIGAASSLLGGVAAVLTVVPWVLIFYGPTIRRRSKICRELLEPLP